MTEAGFSGGCQCGAVRYRSSVAGAFTVCHCRICQRAVGNLFAPLIEVPRAEVTWTGTPARWASSNIAERGFCPTCGTPLFYARFGSDKIELMAGTVAGGPVDRPIRNHGIETRYLWLGDVAEGGRETFFTEGETCHSLQSEEYR